MTRRLSWFLFTLTAPHQVAKVVGTWKTSPWWYLLSPVYHCSVRCEVHLSRVHLQGTAQQAAALPACQPSSSSCMACMCMCMPCASTSMHVHWFLHPALWSFILQGVELQPASPRPDSSRHVCSAALAVPGLSQPSRCTLCCTWFSTCVHRSRWLC
jgi:hypothetical protein